MSHRRPTRQARDAFEGKVLQAAGLPLLRVPVRRQYDPREVAAQVEPFLTGHPATRAAAIKPEAATGAGTGEPAALLCPKCGIAMVLRTGTRGRHAGRQFYGCANFPRCREIKPVAET